MTVFSDQAIKTVSVNKIYILFVLYVCDFLFIKH